MITWLPLAEAGLELVAKLALQIPEWIARAKAAGELTQEQEAKYKARQEEVFGKDYAKVQS